MKTLNDNIKAVLAVFIIGMAFIYFFVILWIDKKADPQVLIAVVAMVSSATGYYFGSTSSSSKKDDTISTLASNNSTTNETAS